jgi:hypothetical protein
MGNHRAWLPRSGRALERKDELDQGESLELANLVDMDVSGDETGIEALGVAQTPWSYFYHMCSNFQMRRADTHGGGSPMS